MSTNFQLYGVEEKDLYKNKSKEERQKIILEMVGYANEYGIKPAARKYNSCPKTVRKWVRKSKENSLENLKLKK